MMLNPQKKFNGVKKPRLFNKDKIPARLDERNYVNTVFVGNLPAAVTHQDMKDCFKVFGKVVNARIRGHSLKKDAKSRKAGAILKEIDQDNVSAYVQFDTAEQAALAVKANGVNFEGRHLRVDFADLSQQNFTSKKSIYLRNIAYEATEEELREAFSQCGEIDSVRILRNPILNYQPRGMGYINFTSAESVQLALELGKAGVRLNDRKISVFPYSAKKPGADAGAAKPANASNLLVKKPKKYKTKDDGEEFAGNQAQSKKRKHKKFSVEDAKKKKLAEILSN